MSLIIDPDTLTTFLSHAGTVVEECRCEITADGLRIRAVDPANVLMVDTTLEAAAFENYDPSDIPLEKIGFTIDKLQSALGLVDSDTPLQLTVDTGGTHSIRLQAGTLDHRVALIDTASIRESPEIPDLDADLPVEAVLEGSEFGRIQKAAQLVSDHIVVGADPDAEAFVAGADGDIDETEIVLGGDDVIDLEIDTVAEVEALFAMGYFESITRPIDSDMEVALQIGDDMPMTVDFEFADGHGECRYVIAPRIET